MNQTKRIPYVFRSLSILIVILALTIYDISPMQVNARSLADNFNAHTEGIAFAPKVDLETGVGPTHIAIGDLDKDGKPDLVTANYGVSDPIGHTISALRNMSTSGHVNFEAKLDFNTSNGPHGMALVDIDGDGKLDVIVADCGAYGIGWTVSVLLNTSTPGTISFAPKVDFDVGDGPLQVAIGDLDGDGMPDVAVTNFHDGTGTTVTVLRNTSSIGAVSFAIYQTFTVETGPYCLAISDIDGDSKLDIVVTNNGSLTGDGTTVSVLRNTSTLGNISFAQKVNFTVGNGPRGVAIGDLDEDNRPDVVVTNFGNYNGTTVSVLRNTSTSGSIQFASKVDLTVGTAPHGVAISDIDNDNKPDIVVTNFGETTVSVLKNASTSGNLSFADKQDFTVGAGPHSVAIGDLDADNKPDLAVANYGTGGGNTISVLLNMAPTGITLLDYNGMSLPQGIQLGWQTAQEIDLLGFNLLRAESPDGKQVQINPQLIPAINPGQLHGNDYQYLDTTAEPGKLYYYWVDWVGKGSSEIYGPVTVRMVSYWVWLPLGLK